MKVSLIVLNYNDYVTTCEFLDKVRDYEIIDHLIVVDNASTDDSLERLREYADEKTDVICTQENGGYAKGNNYGIHFALEHYNPDYLIISNPDIIFEEELVNDLLVFFENRQEKVGAVSGTMLNKDGTKARNAWRERTKGACIAENLFFLNRLRKGSKYPSKHFETEVSQVDVISGAYFMISSEVMQSIDFFDERTFLFWEEDILGYRLKEKGYKNFILNNTSFIHNHSVSITKNIKSLEKKLDLAEESKRLYMKEYLKMGKIGGVIENCTYFIGKKIFLLARNRNV